jgi:hypothetical protein
LIILAFLGAKGSTPIGILGILLIISGITTVYSIVTLLAFNFDYSAFGKFERTPFPDQPVILKERFRWGLIGYSWNNFPPTWYVFPSGLGIELWRGGKGFIPVSSFWSLKKEEGLVLYGTPYQLEHDSPEVRSPIYLPDYAVFKAVQQIYQSHKDKTDSF